jgi:anaerobic sulfite reductase subunit A
MQVFKQNKKGFFEFLNKLKQSYELIAPVKKDLIRFDKIKDVKDIHLQKNPYFPLKEYFFKKEEILFQFDGKKFTAPKLDAPERVFFGIRRCDLNAIMHQDKVFIEDADDPYYKAAREKSFLLGYHCNKAFPYCFCGSMELKDFHDLMFYNKEKEILVEVGSEKGEFLIKKFRKYFNETDVEITDEESIIPGADRLEEKNISRLYGHPNWKKGVDICLSCGACTALCPTCYCFSIHDEVSVKDSKKGERKRQWSSCQLEEFTKVAGNHIFRKEREERFKHRIYHQLQYFKRKYGMQMCVGCGRCIEGCPTRIDFVKIINEMK